MMRIIGVIDLLGGRAVHAQGGCRHGYRPVQAVADVAVNGDAERLARIYVERLGIRELYVADLDAIAGGAEHDHVVRQIAAAGAAVWIDAGVSTVAQTERALARGASQVVVGLETLPSFDALAGISGATGGEHIALSLDLRGGAPVAVDEVMRRHEPASIAARAAEAGAGAIIVLDLERIGAASGLDMNLLQGIRTAVPAVPLFAGGGVRGADDVLALAAAGYDGVLVATALHDGRLDPHGYVTR